MKLKHYSKLRLCGHTGFDLLKSVHPFDIIHAYPILLQDIFKAFYIIPTSHANFGITWNHTLLSNAAVIRDYIFLLLQSINCVVVTQ